MSDALDTLNKAIASLGEVREIVTTAADQLRATGGINAEILASLDSIIDGIDKTADALGQYNANQVFRKPDREGHVAGTGDQ